MKSSSESFFDQSKVQVKLGVTLGPFIPKCNVAYTHMNSNSIELRVSIERSSHLLDNVISDLSRYTSDLNENGHFQAYYDTDYNLDNVQIAAALSAQSKLTNTYRLLVGYSLPPKAKQEDYVGFKADTVVDFPRFYPNQFSTFTNHIPLFTNLKELYLDQAIRASSIRKHKKKQSTAYIWQKLATAVSKLPQLEVISLRENEISKYSDEDFNGLLELLAAAKTVVYVDLSRNDLHSLKGKRFPRLMTALGNMTSLLSCNITEYEPAKKYAKLQGEFDKLGAVLAQKQNYFTQTGYPSNYVQDLRQQHPVNQTQPVTQPQRTVQQPSQPIQFKKPNTSNPRQQALAMLKQQQQSGLYQKPPAYNPEANLNPRTAKPPTPESGSPERGDGTSVYRGNINVSHITTFELAERDKEVALLNADLQRRIEKGLYDQEYLSRVHPSRTEIGHDGLLRFTEPERQEYITGLQNIVDRNIERIYSAPSIYTSEVALNL